LKRGTIRNTIPGIDIYTKGMNSDSFTTDHPLEVENKLDGLIAAPLISIEEVD